MNWREYFIYDDFSEACRVRKEAEKKYWEKT